MDIGVAAQVTFFLVVLSNTSDGLSKFPFGHWLLLHLLSVLLPDCLQRNVYFGFLSHLPLIFKYKRGTSLDKPVLSLYITSNFVKT